MCVRWNHTLTLPTRTWFTGYLPFTVHKKIHKVLPTFFSSPYDLNIASDWSVNKIVPWCTHRLSMPPTTSSGKGAACWHVFFCMLTCDFWHVTLPTCMFEKKRMSAYVPFLACMLKFELHVDILTCWEFFACCKFFCMLQVLHVTDVNMHVSRCQHVKNGTCIVM